MDKGAPAPIIDTTGQGTSMSTGENTIDLTGLSAGDKEIYIQAKDAAGNISTPLKMDIPAVAPKTYTISPIADQTFTPLTAGYGSDSQEKKSITITKTGTEDLKNITVVLSGPNANDFMVSEPNALTLDNTTKTANFKVWAKDGLAAGTYTATVKISADQMTDVTFTVTQVVNNPASNPPSGGGSGGNDAQHQHHLQVVGVMIAQHHPHQLQIRNNWLSM